MGLHKRVCGIIFQKVLSLLLLLYLIILGLIWLMPENHAELLLEIAPLVTWLYLLIGAAFADSSIGGLLCLAFYYVILIAVGFLSHTAYIIKKKWMRNLAYWIFVLDILMNFIVLRWLAVLGDIILILIVKFLIPFWKPYRVKTIYDWDW